MDKKVCSWMSFNLFSFFDLFYGDAVHTHTVSFFLIKICFKCSRGLVLLFPSSSPSARKHHGERDQDGSRQHYPETITVVDSTQLQLSKRLLESPGDRHWHGDQVPGGADRLVQHQHHRGPGNDKKVLRFDSCKRLF